MSDSYFDKAVVGEVDEDGDKLISKDKISFHKCPFCKSEDTFHKRREGDLGNCFTHATKDSDSNFSVAFKEDLCMKCGHMWIFEVFVYEQV